jgi:acetyl-CoA acetyltransferase
LSDAGIEGKQLQAAYMGNAAAGAITGQLLIPGQIILRSLGVGGIPVINMENACASASTAFNQACSMITAGAYDIVLACGYEKLFHEDKAKTFGVFDGGVDFAEMDGVKARIAERLSSLGAKIDLDGAGASRSLFMDIYATVGLEHMKEHGTTQTQFAAVSAKNSYHGSLNERAQFRTEMSVDEVLAAREIVYPLTLPMCSPIGDGAAAVVLVSERKARELGIHKPVRVVSSVLRSGWDYQPGDPLLTELSANDAYEESGLGPEDLDCVELHDASAPAEVVVTECLGLCEKGRGGIFIQEGHTKLGGKIPVNTSGGLLRKGHPIGATGLAQIVEITEQLQGRADNRQVDGARIGLAENGGGWIGDEQAALVVTILSA